MSVMYVIAKLLSLSFHLKENNNKKKVKKKIRVYKRKDLHIFESSSFKDRTWKKH